MVSLLLCFFQTEGFRPKTNDEDSLYLSAGKMFRYLNKFRKLLLTGILISTIGYFFYITLELSLDYNFLELTDKSIEKLCNCTKILKKDREEIVKAKLNLITKSFRNRSTISDKHYIEWTKDCEKFRVMRKYLTFPLSHEEEVFPIAYSIVIHQKIHSFERMLRSIYSPQNFYCIHVDQKSTSLFQTAVKGIAACFDNVIVSRKQERVVYASWSRVQADINCMEDLYNLNSNWKYFINLCGQDFPIKTNLDIVRKLKVLNGKNNLETEQMPTYKKVRWEKVHKIVNNNIQRTKEKKEAPPVNTPIFAGGAYIVVCRDFVRYVLQDPAAHRLIEWSKDTYSPDEHLWATLQRQPGAPGSVPISNRYDVTDVNSISRLVKWLYFEGQESKGAMYPPCEGHHVRTVCVYGVGDLKWILQQPHLFANKFDSDADYFVLYCLESYLRHKALAEMD